MTTAVPLPHAVWPEDVWQEPVRWQVCSVDEAFAARAAAGELVGSPDDSEFALPTLAAYASARVRVETTIGELAINGLRHGGTPVRASLARGASGWLIVVVDPARRPSLSAGLTLTPSAPSFTSPGGGLGLVMVAGLATEVGWFSRDGSNHVWAMIADTPPSHLLP